MGQGIEVIEGLVKYINITCFTWLVFQHPESNAGNLKSEISRSLLAKRVIDFQNSLPKKLHHQSQPLNQGWKSSRKDIREISHELVGSQRFTSITENNFHHRRRRCMKSPGLRYVR